MLRLGEEDRQLDFRLKDFNKTLSDRVTNFREEFISTQRNNEKSVNEHRRRIGDINDIVNKHKDAIEESKRHL